MRSDDKAAIAPVADSPKQLGFPPINLGKLNEGGSLVHVHGETCGPLVLQNFFKKEQQPIHARAARDVRRQKRMADRTRSDVSGTGNVRALRTTAVTNTLDHPADVAQVQAWCGHDSIATTKLYDRRHRRPEGGPTFKVAN